MREGEVGGGDGDNKGPSLVVNKDALEAVEQFCFLGDMLDCEAAVQSNSCMEKMTRNSQFIGESQHLAED